LTKPLLPFIVRAKVTGFVELFQKTEQIKQQAEQLRLMERRVFESKLAEGERSLPCPHGTQLGRRLAHRPGRDGLYNSPSSRHVLGYEPEEFVGRSGFEIVHPEDMERVGTLLAQLVQQGAPVRVELRVLHKDGGWRWMECVGTNLLAEPAVQAIVVNFRDITARREAIQALRESEQRFARFMQHLPGLAWIKDLDGRYVYANDAARGPFRCPRAGALRQDRYRDIPAGGRCSVSGE